MSTSSTYLSSQVAPPGELACGRYAAIDIGTVTCRLLIADITPTGMLCEVCRELAYTNLGVGVNETGLLSADAIARVVQAVKNYLSIIATHTNAALHPADSPSLARPEVSSRPTALPLRGLRIIATSAARDASNADELIEALAQVGAKLSVIEGTQEAHLSFTGASSAFNRETIAMFDVGGGSTEVILGTAGGRAQTVHSFNIGCRRVTEKFFAADPPMPEQIVAARTWICDSMRDFFESSVLPAAPQRLVGVAGTATTVVSVREKLCPYDPTRVHLAEVSRDDLDEVFVRLRGLSASERKQVPGLAPERAEVILAGLVILQCLLDLAHSTHFTVSELDILHGIIISLSRAAAQG